MSATALPSRERRLTWKTIKLTADSALPSRASSDPTCRTTKQHSLTVTLLCSECFTGVPKLRMPYYIVHGIPLVAGADVDDVLFLLSLAVRCQACLGQTIPERRVVYYTELFSESDKA